MQLRLQVPEQLTGKSQQQLEALAYEALVVRLYALGELSSGEGAKLFRWRNGPQERGRLRIGLRS